MKKSLSLAALSAAMLSAPLASQAATETDTFDVLLNVIGACSIDSASDMNFGSLTQAEVDAGTATATSTIAVNCANGTVYSISLSGENGTNRTMTSTNGSTVPYSLFQPDGTTAWDSTTPVSATATDTDGSTIDSYTVNGTVDGPLTLNGTDATTYTTSTGVDLSQTITVTLTF